MADDYQSSLEDARSAGHSWGDIWNWVAQGTAEADRQGYTQAEIDEHLGFKDPEGFEDSAKASWGKAMADNPKIVEGLASTDPKLDVYDNVDLRSDYVN